jgi:hypothetical protein
MLLKKARHLLDFLTVRTGKSAPPNFPAVFDIPNTFHNPFARLASLDLVLKLEELRRTFFLLVSRGSNRGAPAILRVANQIGDPSGALVSRASGSGGHGA